MAAVLLGGGGSSPPVGPEVLPPSILSADPHTSGPAAVPEPAQPASPSETPPFAASPPLQAGEKVARREAASSPPLHITYAAVGMDQAVLPLSPTDEEMTSSSIVPPHTADAYWIPRLTASPARDPPTRPTSSGTAGRDVLPLSTTSAPVPDPAIN